MRAILSKVRSWLGIESSSDILLFCPFFISIGIYSAYTSSRIVLVSAVTAISLCAIGVFVKNPSKYVTIIVKSVILITCCVLGFCLMQQRSIGTFTPLVDKYYKNIIIRAKVDQIKYDRRGYEVVLKEIEVIDSTDEIRKIPSKIRGIYRFHNALNVGDVVTGDVDIFPLPKKVYPNSYDIEAKYKFRQIGGFVTFKDVLSQDITTEKAASRSLYRKTIMNIQGYIASVFSKMQNKEAKGIAFAMFLGESGGLNQDTIDSMRKSGIMHILSISGLHISIIATILFVLIRRALSIVPLLSLFRDIKQIAALFCIPLVLVYIAVIDFLTPALRSHIMVSIVFLGIAFGRIQNGYRAIAIAAIVILLTTPEELFFAPFQLSFGAVLGLIAFYNFISRHYVVSGAKWWFAGLWVTSIVAQISTYHFVTYHFNAFGTYAILTNLAVVPIVSFIILPCGMLAVACDFLLGGNNFFVTITEMAIMTISEISNIFANLPMSSFAIKSMPNTSFLMCSFGFYVLCILQTPLRLIGIMIYAIGIVLHGVSRTPDLVVSSDFVIFKNGDVFYYTEKIKSDFVENIVKSKLGVEKWGKTSKSGLTCIDGKSICYTDHFMVIGEPKKSRFSTPTKSAIYLREIEPLQIPCRDYLVVYSFMNGILDGLKSCNFKKIITLDEMNKGGTHIVSFEDNKIVSTYGY